MLYTVFPICGYMDCSLILFQDLFISQKHAWSALFFFSDGKVLLELVQIFLINWIAVNFFTLAWWALSVWFCDWKFLLLAFEIFCLSKYSCPMKMEFWGCANMLDESNTDCFVRQAWHALSVFFGWWKVLAQGSWIFGDYVNYELDCWRRIQKKRQK